MKSKVDKLDVNKLVPVPVSDVAKNDVVKKTEYDELVRKLFRLLILVIWSKKLTITQKLLK